MKKLLTLLFLIPVLAFGQNRTINDAGGYTRVMNGATPLDSLAKTNGVGTTGDIPVYNSSIKRFIFTPQSSIVPSISFGTFGSTPNANGGSYSGGVITLQPASASFPGGVTTGPQTFAGNKTLSGTSQFSGNVGFSSGTTTTFNSTVDFTGNATASGQFFVNRPSTSSPHAFVLRTAGVSKWYLGEPYGSGTDFNITNNNSGSFVNAININGSTNALTLSSLTNGLVKSTSGVLSNYSGALAIADGGTGSATQNFVDLSNAQNVGGLKTFTNGIYSQDDATVQGNIINNPVSYSSGGYKILVQNSGNNHYETIAGNSYLPVNNPVATGTVTTPSLSLTNGAGTATITGAASNQTIAFPALSGTVPIFAATPTSGGLVAWSGTAGALTNYSFPTSGSFGYWSRSGTTLSPATSGDNLSLTGSVTAPSFIGNASTATALATARTIGTLTGDGTSAGSSFNGTANNTNALTLATVNSNVGSFGSATQAGTFTVNGKGLLTAAGNTTITPAIGSVTGLGTGIATALAINTGSSGSVVTYNGNAGTPSALVGTNITGTASGLNIGGNAATVTTNANLTGAITSSGNTTSLNSFSSANLLSALTNETGSGVAVFATSPTLVTPNIGAATGTSGTFTDGTKGLVIQPYTAGTTFGAIYPVGVTPGNSNFAFAGSALSSEINGSVSSSLSVGGIIKLKATVGGVVSAGTLGINGTDNSVTSGTYTTTATAVTNTSSATGNDNTHYTRIGNEVSVWGTVSTTITLGSLASSIDVDLPIASGFTAVRDAQGTGSVISTGGGQDVYVFAETTGNKARIQFLSGVGSAGNTVGISYSYTYTVK